MYKLIRIIGSSLPTETKNDVSVNKSDVITIERVDFYRWENCSRGTAFVLYDEAYASAELRLSLEKLWADLGFETCLRKMDSGIVDSLQTG